MSGVKYLTFFIFALFISISFLMLLTLNKKRDQFEGEVDRKSYVSPFCFLGAGVLGFIVSMTSFMSVVIWWGIVLLVVVGAYFTKYLPKPK